MRCDQIEDQLSAYADGELDTGTHAVVEAHLSQCDSCRKMHRWVVTFHRLTAQVPEEAPSEEFHVQLMARVAAAQRPTRARSHRAFLATPVALGLGAAVVVSAFMAMRPPREATPIALPAAVAPAPAAQSSPRVTQDAPPASTPVAAAATPAPVEVVATEDTRPPAVQRTEKPRPVTRPALTKHRLAAEPRLAPSPGEPALAAPRLADPGGRQLAVELPPMPADAPVSETMAMGGARDMLAMPMVMPSRDPAAPPPVEGDAGVQGS